MLATMTKKRMRSDYRTAPRDKETASGLTFTDYLLGPFLRGYDWTPDRPPSGVLQIHHQARNAAGFVFTEAGKPKMRRLFLKWAAGEKKNERGVTNAQVKTAIELARQQDPEAIAVLELRQGKLRMTPVAFMVKHEIKSDSTLTKRFYRAVRLVLENLMDVWERND